MPPSTDPAVQIAAKRRASRGWPIPSAISSTSGGIGKNDDSANAMANSAQAAEGRSAQPIVQW